MERDYPSKLYYSISEVAKITEIKAHVLRYWETEFSTLKPKKARSGSRRYRQRDIEEIFAIKDLLYNNGYKIAAAKKLRSESKVTDNKQETVEIPQLAMQFDSLSETDKFDFLKKELREIRVLLTEMKELQQDEKAKKKSSNSLKAMKADG